MKNIMAVDLFCGAGGTSEGLRRAAARRKKQLSLMAVNHWPVAVKTHELNHPTFKVVCADLDNMNPRHYFKMGEVDILWASPECRAHSQASGRIPVNDQSRATAFCVLRWAEALLPPVIVIENVAEFEKWGPIGSDQRPLKSKRGKIFHAWIAALESFGYRVEWRVLCAADYGDPTSRRRLFIFAVRGRRKIVWPEPSHIEEPSNDFFSVRKQWRGAEEIIDWTIPGESIFTKKKQLVENTMRRIEMGLMKFGLQPFIIPQQQGGALAHPLGKPLNTITTTSRGMAFVQPFLVKLRGTAEQQLAGSSQSIQSPLPTITAGGGHLALVNPFLVQCSHGNSDENGDARRSLNIKNPLPTIAGHGNFALVEPMVVSIDNKSSDQIRSVKQPLSTITVKGRHALVMPYLVKYQGTATAADIEKPLPSMTTRDRFGLCVPIVIEGGETLYLDIHFRMLKPNELAAAHSFPSDYQFTGGTTKAVKQIGNSVPCELAAALGTAALDAL